jgi:hypothetical protein
MFLSIAAVAAFAHCLQRRRWKPIRGESVGQPFSALSLTLAFDPDHAIIWGTQMPVLQLIGSAGQRGVRKACLGVWYFTFSRQYPELCDGYDFHEWLEFLKRMTLVKPSGRNIVLTPEGARFVSLQIGQTVGLDALHA